MTDDLRQRRRARATDELVGERGEDGKQAVRWSDLANHPVIRLLFGKVDEAAQSGGADTTQIEADIDQLETSVSGLQTDVSAAQTDATNAGSTANQALSDAAAAQSDATQALSDAAAVATNLSSNYYTIAQTDSAIAGSITTYDAGAAGVASITAVIEETDGFATAFSGLTATVDGSDNISGFKATTWADPDGSGGGVLELLGDVIVPGTLAANKLTVGLNANDFINPDFMAPLAPNWVTHGTSGGTGAATTLAINPAGDPYAWSSFPTLSAYQNDGSTDGFYKFACRPVQDIGGTLAPGWAVTPGERVSFSARVSAHRCTGSIEIVFMDGAGNSLGTWNDMTDAGMVSAFFATSSAGPVGSDANPDLWDLLFMVVDAPANAAYYLPVFRKGPSGSGDANSEMFVARPMHCRVHGNATTPTPYSPPGSTLIDGSAILTGSVTADKITVASLDALSANLGTIEVGSANIADAAITNAKIGNIIESSNYVAGNSGWRINKNGDAEFNSLVVREDNIEDGAVTQKETVTSNISINSSDQDLQIFNQNVLNSVASSEIVEMHITIDLQSSQDPDPVWLTFDFYLDSTLVASDDFRTTRNSNGTSRLQKYQITIVTEGGGTLSIDFREEPSILGRHVTAEYVKVIGQRRKK